MTRRSARWRAASAVAAGAVRLVLAVAAVSACAYLGAMAFLELADRIGDRQRRRTS